MRKLSLILILATGFVHATDIFEDIPSPFAGVNVALSVATQGHYGANSNVFNTPIVTPNIFFPKALIEVSYNQDHGFWLRGGSVSMSFTQGEYTVLSVSQWSNDGLRNNLLATKPRLSCTASLHQGFMPNPSTLLKLHLGAGIENTEYHYSVSLNQAIQTKDLYDEYILFIESGLSMTLNLLDKWSIEMGIDARKRHTNALTFEDPNVGEDEAKPTIDEEHQIAWISKLGIVYHHLA